MPIPPKCVLTLLASLQLASLPLAATALAGGGPINPPAGAITSTSKTLTDVEPRTAINATNTPGDNDGTPSVFKITQPGSYYLTGNITSVDSANRNGVEVAVPAGQGTVTIDLCGFDLAGGTGSGSGILATTGSPRGLTIRNGTVRGWGAGGGAGVDTSADGARLENLHAVSNSGTGLRTANGGVIVNCTATVNGGTGINVGYGSTVTACTAHSNGGDGFIAGNGCTLTGCSATLNGTDGFDLATGCTLSACSAQANSSDGVQLGSGCTVTATTTYGNGGCGILSNGDGATIDGCTARVNSLDGIRVATASVVRGCTTATNGNGASDGAGIHATGTRNRIEGNFATSNDRGIDVDASVCIIIRNTASTNTTNYTIAANNFYGPIIDRTATATVAVSGDAATGTMGSDSNANFSH